MINCLNTKWPFICFQGLNNKSIMIIEAHDPDTVLNIEIPDNPEKIIDTYITETNDLFVMVLNKENYNLYKLDLDPEK